MGTNHYQRAQLDILLINYEFCVNPEHQTHFAMHAHKRLKSKQLAMGKRHKRPQKRNSRSPGSLPTPNFLSQGDKPSIKISAKRTTKSQRIICATSPLLSLSLAARGGSSKRVRAVAQLKPHGCPIRPEPCTQCQHLEEFPHFMLGDEFLCHGTFCWSCML